MLKKGELLLRGHGGIAESSGPDLELVILFMLRNCESF